MINSLTYVPRMPVAKMSAAQIANERYTVKDSIFLTVKQRLDEYQSHFAGSRTELEHAVKRFQSAHKNTSWNDHSLCKAAICKLSQILIDDTMNRPLVWRHVIKILDNFDANKIMSVNVYEDPLRPGFYVAWDGQHTSIVLLIIISMCYSESASKIDIPITIYNIKDKSKIRENFITLNGEGKEPISALAMWENMVRGARHEGSTKEEWIDADVKQKLIAAAGMFLTEVERGDDDQPGATTYVTHFISHSVTCITYFTTYWKYRAQHENRAIESKELFLMLQLFSLFESQGVPLTDAAIKDMVTILWDAFECEFTTKSPQNKFFRKVEIAYLNWFKQKYFPNARATVWKELTDRQKEMIDRPLNMLKVSGTKQQDPYYIAFILQQLVKSGFTHRLPDRPVNFSVGYSDLW